MADSDFAIAVDDGQVYQFVADVLSAAGATSYVAESTARGLWTASIRGVDSHGIRLLPHYVKELEEGRINPDPEFDFDQTAATVGRFDADHTYGIAAGDQAMTNAIDLAEEAGVGHVSVRNSSHCGSMAFFGLKAAREGMIGYATTHGTANTKTPGSNRPFFGNNPVCMTAPMADEGPFCFDAAVTPISFNEVRKQRDTGDPLPPGSAADDEGNETRNPDEASQLQYIGDYKGFGLAMANDIFCGLLSGMPVGRDISSMYGDPLSQRRYLGHYFVAIRIDVFVNPDEFKSRLQKLADDVRSEPPVDDNKPVQVPGDPEKEVRVRREAEGIPIEPHDVQRFDEIAKKYDLTPIEKRD